MTDGSTPTLFPEDSRVSRSVRPGSAEARTMTATSGRRCYELFACYVHATSWQKTFLDCFLSTMEPSSSLCVLTWSVKDTKFSRSIIRLRASAPRTYATEFSSSHTTPYPTPTATPYGSNGNGSGNNTNSRDHPSLERMVATPTAKANQFAPSMQKWPSCAAMLPTPVTPKGSGGDDLATRVARMIPTPAARDYKGANGAEHLENGTGRLYMDQLPDYVRHGMGESGGQLNPTFVEYLMGFPENWTEV